MLVLNGVLFFLLPRCVVAVAAVLPWVVVQLLMIVYPYGKAVSLRISCEYAANNWRTALFAVIVRNIFTSCREYPANKTGQSKK